MSITMTNRSPKKILIVTGDCPSHPYACCKLATVLADVHEVTLAGPNVSLDRLQAEMKVYHNSANSKNKIKVESIGDVSTVVHCNVRRVINPQEYSPFQIIYNTIFNRKYNPFGIAELFEQVMDDQIGTYENLKSMIPNYDLVYAVHSCATTVCDAAEALQQEDSTLSVPPCVVFSSLPYESSFIYNGLWNKPRSLVALPHVATYSWPMNALKGSKGFVRVIFAYLVQLFWMWLDTYHTERAWKKAGKRNDIRRAERGLLPVFEGNRYYWKAYPVLSLGGFHPYMVDGDIIANNATVVGSIRSTETSDLKRLYDWLIRTRVDKIVYASFGTGTQLSEEEVANLAKLTLSLKDTRYSLLLSLQTSEQERLRHVFDRILGPVDRVGSGFCEYLSGKFRIDDNVPQENLLLSKKVDLFISHLGFGGFIEGVNGGVPFICYPSGCDQWFNVERVVDAGIGIKAKPLMKDLDVTVFDALGNASLKHKSYELATKAAAFDSTKIILDMADDLCDGATESSDADSL